MDEPRERREQKEVHEQELRRYEHSCAWSAYQQIRSFIDANQLSLNAFLIPPRRPEHLHQSSHPFYFAATCAHIGDTPPAEVLVADYDDHDPVEALEAALFDFGLDITWNGRADFLHHVFLSGRVGEQVDVGGLVTASSMPSEEWKLYRFALYVPETYDAERQRSTGLTCSAIWVHRIDYDDLHESQTTDSA